MAEIRKLEDDEKRLTIRIHMIHLSITRGMTNLIVIPFVNECKEVNNNNT